MVKTADFGYEVAICKVRDYYFLNNFDQTTVLCPFTLFISY